MSFAIHIISICSFVFFLLLMLTVTSRVAAIRKSIARINSIIKSFEEIDEIDLDDIT
ncbi:MAG: hypothetical protein ACLFQK_09245 [Fibrobacterota bacterium]